MNQSAHVARQCAHDAGAPGQAATVHDCVVATGQAAPPLAGCVVITGVTLCVPVPHVAEQAP